MKWAILLYATLIFPTGEKQQVISWNIPFSSYEQCEQFYKKEKDTLHKGVLDHGKEVYHPEIQLVEMGCAVAMFSFLPLCQFKSGNVIVDFFTIKLNPKKKALLNGIASFIFFMVAAFFSWRMIYGGMDMYKYNEQTMRCSLHTRVLAALQAPASASRGRGT